MDTEQNQSISTPEQSLQLPTLDELGQGTSQVEGNDFANQFEKATGFSIEEFQSAARRLQEIETKIESQIKTMDNERQVEQQLFALQERWGVDNKEFESRLEKIQEKFNSYDEEMQSRLDSVEGADLLWKAIQQESKSTVNKVPKFLSNRNQSGNQQTKAQFTKSQLIAMPEEEYEALQPKILEAFKNGAVIDDL